MWFQLEQSEQKIFMDETRAFLRLRHIKYLENAIPNAVENGYG